MIPGESPGPGRRSDAGHIEADILALERLAARLAADVEHGYAPRAVTVSDTLLTRLPVADRGFSELGLFVHAHEQAQNVTLQNVYNYANGTYGLATAAHEVGEKYRGTDADAQAGLRKTGQLR